MPRYKHSELEVIGWWDASLDPRYRGTEHEFRSKYPLVFQPIYAVIGSDEIVELEFETEDNDGVEVTVQPCSRNEVDFSHSEGECLKLEVPIPVKPGYIGFVDADSDEQKYVPWEEALERINAFVSEMRPKGDAAFRAGDMATAAEAYALTYSASHQFEDKVRLYLAEGDENLRETWKQDILESFAKVAILEPDCVPEEEFDACVERVRAEIVSSGASDNAVR